MTARKKVVVCSPIGAKLGNAAMSWLHAYAHAQRVGADFLCAPWIGERVFELPAYGRPSGESFPERNEFTLKPDEVNVTIRTYAQSTEAMIYTREQARSWLRLMLGTLPDGSPCPWRLSNDELDGWLLNGATVAHRRVGDYTGYGFPIVSLASIHRAAEKFELKGELQIVSEEKPHVSKTVPADLAWLPDFLILLRARTLLRANSSFSWLAATLGYGRVFAPVITPDMKGGVENDCEFVVGNWPRLHCLDFTTDLRMPT